MTLRPRRSRGYTVEVIEGSGLYNRMVENFRRWSGNMLRNGQPRNRARTHAHAILHLVVL